MIRVFITSLLLSPWTVFSDEGTDVFDPLEIRIETQLEEGNLHPAAKAAIRAQWAEYKRAFDRPSEIGEFHGTRYSCGFESTVQIKSVEEYSGSYVYESIANRPDLPGPHLKIEVTDEKRVFVLMDSRRIPAVVNNKIIFFTDGEFRRERATFGTKTFASLNISMIYRTKHVGMVMGPTDAFFHDLSRLLRFEQRRDKAEQDGAGQPATTKDSKAE